MNLDVIAIMGIAILPQEIARKISVRKDGRGCFAMKVVYHTLKFERMYLFIFDHLTEKANLRLTLWSSHLDPIHITKILNGKHIMESTVLDKNLNICIYDSKVHLCINNKRHPMVTISFTKKR